VDPEKLLDILEVRNWLESPTTRKVLATYRLHKNNKLQELVKEASRGEELAAAKLASQIEILDDLLTLDTFLHFIDRVDMLRGEESNA